MSPNLIKHEYVDPKTKRSKIKKYERGEMLGRGGFAYCYAIESFDTQKKYACKIISKSKLKKKTTRLKLITEIKVHKLVSGHKNIVRFVKWFEDKERVYIVLELCKNKSLLDLVKTRGKLTESEVRYFMAQILSALRHIHSNNVIHRDLKLGNIFVCSNYMLKLGDFGLATKLEWRSQRKTTLCGTPNYIAPEMLQHNKKGHSFEVDVWSLGVIMYTMLVGRPPFETEDVKDTYNRIKHNLYRFPEDSTLSEVSKNLIRKILQVCPDSRPTLHEIRVDKFFTTALIPRNLPSSTGSGVPVITNFKESISKSAQEYGKEESLMEASSERKPMVEKVKDGRLSPKSELFRSAVYSRRARNSFGMSGEMAKTTRSEPKISKQIDNLEKDYKRFSLEQDEESDRLEKIDNFDLYEPSVWIECWIDYSSKYGIGYILSNGIYGALFNDNSKMLLYSDRKHIEYFEPGEKEENGVYLEKRITLDTFRYSSIFKKKVTLLKYFSEYLKRKNSKEIEKDETTNLKRYPVRLMNWFKTSKAKVFVFSNSVFQILFNDKTEIIATSPCCLAEKKQKFSLCEKHCSAVSELERRFELYVEKVVVTFTKKNGDKETCLLSEATSSENNVLKQRALYLKEVVKKVTKTVPRLVLLERMRALDN